MFTEPLEDGRCFIFIISWRLILFLTQILLLPLCKTKELRLGVVAKLIQGHAVEGVILNSVQFSHSKSRVRLFVTPWTTARQASLTITNSWSLLKFMPIKSVMPSNHLILLLSPSPPALNLSPHQNLFQWVSSLHQVAKALELQLQHQSFQWIFRTDFL